MADELVISYLLGALVFFLAEMLVTARLHVSEMLSPSCIAEALQYPSYLGSVILF
jgi:hypothetical protein